MDAAFPTWSKRNKDRAKHRCCRHHSAWYISVSSLSSSQIETFTIHNSQRVGLHSLVALRNRFYPDGIWWARTREVYPDGVVGVLKRALAIPNSRACRNTVGICEWNQSLFGTTWLDTWQPIADGLKQQCLLSMIPCLMKWMLYVRIDQIDITDVWFFFILFSGKVIVVMH